MPRPPVLVSLAAAAALLVGCSDDGGGPAAGGPDAAGAAEAAAAVDADAPAGLTVTRTTVRVVTGGRLSPEARTQLRDRVTATVDAWFEAAYLGGDYPRTDFDDAWAVFTDGARRRAEEDRRLMSNAAVGETTYAVRATARRLSIDVLADGGRAAAVTARFRLGLARAGETGAERTERVTGRLMLTFAAGDGWRVFGYDVDRGLV